MKAIAFDRYGPPEILKVVEADMPVPVGRQVLVKVAAAAINPADYVLVEGATRVMTGIFRPKINRLGLDVAGTVVAIGDAVTRFQPGDQVYGACIRDPYSSGRNVWLSEYGSYAEFTLTHEDALAPKPAHLPFDQVAGVASTAWTALQGLRTFGKIKPGESVLISSATGGVGTFAVQIAKALGAHVTAVCSTKNIGLVRTLGADAAVDYTKKDYTRQGHRYDLIFDSVGEHSLSRLRRTLKPGGRVVIVGKRGVGLLDFFLTRVFAGTVLSWFTRDIVVDYSHPHKDDLLFITELLESGRIQPVVAEIFDGLTEVPRAVRLVKDSRANGKVVVRLEQ